MDALKFYEVQSLACWPDWLLQSFIILIMSFILLLSLLRNNKHFLSFLGDTEIEQSVARLVALSQSLVQAGDTLSKEEVQEVLDNINCVEKLML